MRDQVLKRWYAVFIDSHQAFPNISPLLDESTWSMIPFMAKHILRALGTDDEALVLVTSNGLSGSSSIFYHSRFDKDRAFYEGKQRVLTDYMKTHDVRDDVSLRMIVEAKDGYGIRVSAR